MEAPPRSKWKAGQKPFRFLHLPAEIRLRIYEMVLVEPVERTIDLGAYNHHKIAPLLRVFHTSTQIHEEAFRVFYGSNTFRLFSTDGKFFHAKYPLLARLSPRYHFAITSLEVRLGPGWTKPPKSWVISPKMGLYNCKAVKLLKIFVELDPASSMICREWLSNRSSYTNFSTQLVIEILTAVPSITEVRFDGFPSVPKDGPLITALLKEAKKAEKRVTYGPLRGWNKEKVETAKVELVDPRICDGGALGRPDSLGY